MSERIAEPRISVIIPTYNRSVYLRRAVESVLAQAYGSLEVVISDNCSSDTTETIVRGFNDPRIRYFRNARNIDMVPNWNAGIRRAQGEYIALLEDDNWWDPNYLTHVVEALRGHPSVGFVHTAAFLTDAEGRVAHVHTRGNEDRICAGLSELRELLQGNKILLSTVTARRECLRAVGLFDETIPYAADWELWLRLSLHYPAAYLATPLAFYRVHEGSGTARVHARPLVLFADHRRVIEKTLRAIQGVYGKHIARDLRRLSYRWLLGLQIHRAWNLHHAGELSAARREATLALACAPQIIFHFPLRVAAIFFASLLPRRLSGAFLALEKRVGQPLMRRVRSTLRGPV